MTLATKLTRQTVRDIVLRVLSHRFGVPVEKLTAGGRRSEQVSAKRAAIWFLVVKLQHPTRATAQLLGYRDHTTVINHASDLRQNHVANSETYAGIEKEIIVKFMAAEATVIETDTFWTVEKRSAMACLWERTPMTPDEIGRALGCTTETINKAADDWGLMSDDFPILNPYDDEEFERLLNRTGEVTPQHGLTFWTPPRATALFALLKYTPMHMQEIGVAMGTDHTRMWEIAERLGAFPRDAERPIPTEVGTVSAQPSSAETRI